MAKQTRPAGKRARKAIRTPYSETVAGADMRSSTIVIPADLLRLLRLAAIARADRHGGRPSVSDVIRDLLERHRKELETEAAG